MYTTIFPWACQGAPRGSFIGGSHHYTLAFRLFRLAVFKRNGRGLGDHLRHIVVGLFSNTDRCRPCQWRFNPPAAVPSARRQTASAMRVLYHHRRGCCSPPIPRTRRVLIRGSRVMLPQPLSPQSEGEFDTILAPDLRFSRPLLLRLTWPDIYARSIGCASMPESRWPANLTCFPYPVCYYTRSFTNCAVQSVACPLKVRENYHPHDSFDSISILILVVVTSLIENFWALTGTVR